jgi:GntR family transcriptional repressor for pyruvate dehydrogenase complex
VSPSDSPDVFAPPLLASQQVAEWILRFVTEAGLAAGDRLPSEHDLTRRTGAGRSSVREALRLLVGRGIVEARAGRGYYLGPPGPRGADRPALPTQAALGMEEVQDLMEARIIIEGACAALAASRATPADVARIESLLGAMEAKAVAARSVHGDALTLHLMIAEAAHNRTLREMLGLIVPKIAAHGARAASEIPGQAAIEVAFHRELWAQIRRGDPDQARAAMERHIRDASSLYLLPYEWQALKPRTPEGA